MADRVARTTPPSLTALGRRALPSEIEVGGRRYVQRRVFKNDFFAATALYEGQGEKVILKVGRQASFMALPLGWIGRLLAARERAAMERLHGLEGIPRLIGGWGPAGIVREYIEGCPLSEAEYVPDDFFQHLTTLIEAIHHREMAYADLEKPENVLVGEDGYPYLFDFQTSWNLPARWGGNLWAARVLRQWLQAGDRYHLLKLQRRTRPDQLSAEAKAASYRRPWYHRGHALLTRPFTRLRRRVLGWVDPQRKEGERGRVSKKKRMGAA